MKTQISAHSALSMQIGEHHNSSNFRLYSKTRLFQFCWYFAIFLLILGRFEARNVSKDRAGFPLQNGLFVIFPIDHFLWERDQIWKKCGPVWWSVFKCGIRLYYQSKWSQPEFWICCSPVHSASFGIFPFEKFHPEMITFFFTKDPIC